MTRRDPIVEEVRKHRAQIAREHGNDVETIVQALEGDAPSETAPMVSFPPKRLRASATPRRRQAKRRLRKALESAVRR